jgi:hypothetical protein
VRRNKAKIKTLTDGTVQKIGGPGVVVVDNNWEFGQVLAVVMIFANANEILHFLFGYLGRRKLRRDRERQAQTEDIPLQHEGHSAPTFYRSRGPSGSNVSGKDSLLHELVTGKDTKLGVPSS